MKISPAVPEICLWTDRQIDRQTDRNITLPYRGGVLMLIAAVISYSFHCWFVTCVDVVECERLRGEDGFDEVGSNPCNSQYCLNFT